MSAPDARRWRGLRRVSQSLGARRRSVCALALLVASGASADADARWSFLVRQLTTAQDPRARVQAALTLGATEDASALAPLCKALADPEPLVRAAVARSLPNLHDPAALDCLLAHGTDSDSLARQEVARAVATLREVRARHPKVYVAVTPVVDDSDPPADASLLSLAHTRLVSRLRWMGAQVAPESEDRSAVGATLAGGQLQAFQIRTRLARKGSEVAVVMVCLSYPDQQVLGEVTGRASGGRPEDALRALVPRLLQDLAATFEWKL
ncbi:MAG: HEAT repeat domain-containing protein [Myxococcaceae bacterium]